MDEAARRASGPSPSGEAERLARLAAYGLKTGQRLAEFDELAELAALVMGAPVAYVNIIDADTVWSLGQYPAAAQQDAQVWPRRTSLCAQMVERREAVLVRDVLQDPNTAAFFGALALELPNGSPIGSYAGVPILAEDGNVLGSLSVLGPQARNMPDDRLSGLAQMGLQVQRTLAYRLERQQLRLKQMALAERQDAFEQAMEIAGETFWDWDLVTNRMGHARNRARMLGYEDVPEHLDQWVAVSHPDDREPVAQLIRAHLRGETPEYEAEYRQRHRDGHWIWVRSRGRVTDRDPATGKPLRMRGTVVDITRRKELEARIAQMNEDLLLLVRSLPDAVLHKDSEGQWVFANPAARDVFAESSGEPPDEADRAAWALRAAQTRLETREVGGRMREYEVQRVPIFGTNGQPKAMVLIARDLWHQREQEEIMRRALGQAEEAARSKTQFLATMAH